jgi:hypothetical protein
MHPVVEDMYSNVDKFVYIENMSFTFDEVCNIMNVLTNTRDIKGVQNESHHGFSNG